KEYCVLSIVLEPSDCWFRVKSGISAKDVAFTRCLFRIAQRNS
ncbi:10805_t:CDS:1, partial [Scutellospora calospora]